MQTDINEFKNLKDSIPNFPDLKENQELLYHGSNFLNPELKPGFEYSGVEVQWDETESNRFLYASTDILTTCIMGFASSIEKNFTLEKFQHRDKTLNIYFSQFETNIVEKLLALKVYFYVIVKKPEDNWIKVNNKVNNINNEYKTQSMIAYESVSMIDLKTLLKDFKINVYFNDALYMEKNLPEFSKWK